MEGTEDNKVMPAKKPKRKVLKIIVGILVLIILVLILGVVFALPAYVSSDSCRKMILARANAAGAGAIDFADLSMSWGKGISISRLSFTDSDESMSVAVKGFSTRPNYSALLRGDLSFGDTLIDEPKIEIDIEKMKEKPAAEEVAGEKGKAEAGRGVPIQRIDLVVRDGDVKIKGLEGAVEVSKINSRVNLRPEGEKSEFELDASVAGGGAESTISSKGSVKPGKNWDLKGTSGDVVIEVNNLSMSQLESILAIAGVDIGAKGIITANLKGAMQNGVIEAIDVNVKGSGLEITAPQLKGDTIKTSVLDISARIGQRGNLVNVENLTVQTDWLRAEANGAAPMSIASVGKFMKANSEYELKANLGCDLAAIAGQLPKTLGLKEGMKLTGGKLVCSVETLAEPDGKKLAGQVSIEGLAGVMDGKPMEIEEPIRAEAKIAAEGEKIRFEKANVKSAFANISCTGTTEAFDYDAQADLAKLSSELGQFADIGKYKLGGQFTSEGKIGNSKSTTMIVAQSNIANMRVSPTADITITEPNASVDIIAAFDKEKQVLLVKQLKADTSLGQYSIKDGRIPFGSAGGGATGKGTKEPMLLTATAHGVDLSKLQPYLVMSKAISKDVQLGGVVESDVTVSYRDGVYKLTTESTKVSKLLVKSPGKEAFMQETVELILDAEVNPTTDERMVKADITSPDIKVKGNYQQKPEGETTKLDGSAQLDYDWKTISGMLSAFMPSGLSIEGKRKDTISFSSRYPTGKTDQMLANLNAKAKVGFDKAGYMGLDVGATNVDVKVDKGLLTIAPFKTTVNSGEFNFGGSADFKQKPAMFRTPGPMNIVRDVQLNVEMANKLLAKVNPVFFGVSSISGAADFNCDAMAVPITGGRPEDADIAGTISLSDVKMQPTGLLGAILTATGSSEGQMMRIHPTPFVVKEGFVRYENMQMDIGDMPINFAGNVPLNPDRKIENFSVALPVSATGKIVRVGEEAGSRTTVYVKGTPRRPELDLGKMLQEQAIQTGLDLLLEKAKKK